MDIGSPLWEKTINRIKNAKQDKSKGAGTKARIESTSGHRFTCPCMQQSNFQIHERISNLIRIEAEQDKSKGVGTKTRKESTSGHRLTCPCMQPSNYMAEY